MLQLMHSLMVSCSRAVQSPTHNHVVTISPVLEQKLIQKSLDWLSQSWRRMLTTICRWEWPAQNTAKTYRAAQKRYLEVCERFSLQPLPATEQVLILFVAELAQSVSHTTIRCTKSSFDKRVVRSTNEDIETGSSSKWHPKGKGTSPKGEIAH